MTKPPTAAGAVANACLTTTAKMLSVEDSDI